MADNKSLRYLYLCKVSDARVLTDTLVTLISQHCNVIHTTMILP